MHMKKINPLFIIVLLYIAFYAIWRNLFFFSEFRVEVTLFRNLGIILLILTTLFYTIKRGINYQPTNILLYAFGIYSFTQYMVLSAEQSQIYVAIFSISIPLTYLAAQIFSYKLDFLFIKKILIFLFLLMCISYFIVNISNTAGSFFIHSGDRMRHTFGFIRPSQNAEIILVMFYALALLHTHSMIKKINSFFIFVLILIMLYLSGAKAAMVSLIVFFASIAIFPKIKTQKAFLGICFVFFVLFFIVVYIILTQFTFSELNRISSTRLIIWTNHFNYYCEDLVDFIFGSSKIYEISRVFHTDSFYVDLLLSKGMLGLTMILVYIYLLFKQAVSYTSKAIILSAAIYGLFESTIFNFAAPFGFMPLLFILIEKRLLLKNSNNSKLL